MKLYSELIKLKTYRERLEYLQLDGQVGADTFGWNRYLNQNFYRSKEWKRVRDSIIIRDNGCDMGLEGFDLQKGSILIHHLNPITKEDILGNLDSLLDPENLICVSHKTHNAIHYGIAESAELYLTGERSQGDTKLW